MKKKLKPFLVVLLLSSIGFLGYKIASTLTHKKEVAERIQSIPNFSFVTLQGAPYTQKDLPKNKPVVFVYFNSGCNYCQSEATKIHERLEDLKHTQLVFVSFEKTSIIEEFAKEYNLLNQENVLFLEDKKGQFSQLFDVHTIPYIVVYNADKKLLQKFKGLTKIDNILEVLK